MVQLGMGTAFSIVKIQIKIPFFFVLLGPYGQSFNKDFTTTTRGYAKLRIVKCKFI